MTSTKISKFTSTKLWFYFTKISKFVGGFACARQRCLPQILLLNELFYFRMYLFVTNIIFHIQTLSFRHIKNNKYYFYKHVIWHFIYRHHIKIGLKATMKLSRRKKNTTSRYFLHEINKVIYYFLSPTIEFVDLICIGVWLWENGWFIKT